MGYEIKFNKSIIGETALTFVVLIDIINIDLNFSPDNFCTN